MAAPLDVLIGAAAHAAIPARVRAAVDVADAAGVRVLGTASTTVEGDAITFAAVAREHRKSWTAFNLWEQP